MAFSLPRHLFTTETRIPGRVWCRRAVPVEASLSFGELTSDERRHLREWQATAGAIGIDGVDDLTLRPWPCPVEGIVIGIFTAGSQVADWLVVGDGRAWAVADLAKGRVSETVNSLTEALALIYPGPRRGASTLTC